MESLTAVGILVIGIWTKVMMGFSSTVWASERRTGLLLLVSLITCTAVLLNRWAFKS